MSEPSTSPEFTVAVEGAFDEAGVWVITTRVTFRRKVSEKRRAELVGAARLELLEGIAREGLRGRSLGAKEVRVSLDDPGREFWPEGMPGLGTIQ